MTFIRATILLLAAASLSLSSPTGFNPSFYSGKFYLQLSPEQISVVTTIYKIMEPYIFADIPNKRAVFQTNHPGLKYGPGKFSMGMATALTEKVVEIGKSVSPGVEKINQDCFLAMFNPTQTHVVMLAMKTSHRTLQDPSGVEVKGTFFTLFQRFVFGVMNRSDPNAGEISANDFKSRIGGIFNLSNEFGKQIYELIVLRVLKADPNSQSAPSITFPVYKTWGETGDIFVRKIFMIEAKQNIDESPTPISPEAIVISG